MLFSFGLLCLGCLFTRLICERLSLPPLFGYILTGIALGPFALNVLDTQLLDLSAFIRKLALILILCRAGLGMNLNQLKKNGVSAVLMCFVPAVFEIIGYLCVGPMLGLDVSNSLVLGCVMGAVSPAVVVPRMLKIEQLRYGTEHGIPQTIMAGASMDDIFVITLFSAFLIMARTGGFSWGTLLDIPVSIVLGIAAGWIAGKILYYIISRLHLSSVLQVILILAVSALLCALEDALEGKIAFASLLGVVVMTLMLQKIENKAETVRTFSSVWTWAEMMLFAFVGTLVNPSYLESHFVWIVLAMAAALAFRCIGVWAALLPSHETVQEKEFTMLAYMPKATVQAAIGGLPLAAGLPSGQLILAFAAASILITAPVGAWLIDHFYPRLLQHSSDSSSESTV